MQLPEQWERAPSSKYSCPHMRASHQQASQPQEQQRYHQLLQMPMATRLGPMETIDDFITNESGNSLLLCVFSILLVFPGAACLLVIGAAFTLDLSLQERHHWVRPCAIAMLVLGLVLLATAGAIFASICRSYRRARVRRQLAPVVVSAGGSPSTCIVPV